MNKTDLPIKHIKSQFPEEIPDAYIKGYVEFYKLKFRVTHDVLIPRPETELLVDEVIDFIGSDPMASMDTVSPRTKKGPTLTVLDVGTGAGNIAISIAKNAPNVRIFATDVSPAALEMARENARLNKVENKIFFIQSDLLSAFRHPELGSGSIKKIPDQVRNDSGGVDIIVANLPYIPTSRIAYLDLSVKDFEPRIALDGGPDGFELYRKLFDQIRRKFLPNSLGDLAVSPPRWNLKLIVCEIDETQGDLAIQEAQKLVVSEVEPYFPKAKIEVKTDLVHKQRILLIKF